MSAIEKADVLLYKLQVLSRLSFSKKPFKSNLEKVADAYRKTINSF